MNSPEFVNPKTRIAIFKEVKAEQMNLYQRRSSLLKDLDISRPTMLNKAFVAEIDE